MAALNNKRKEVQPLTVKRIRWAELPVSKRRPTGEYEKSAFYHLVNSNCQSCLQIDSKLAKIISEVHLSDLELF